MFMNPFLSMHKQYLFFFCFCFFFFLKGIFNKHRPTNHPQSSHQQNKPLKNSGCIPKFCTSSSSQQDIQNTHTKLRTNSLPAPDDPNKNIDDNFFTLKQSNK